MNIIQNELTIVKEELVRDFIDPISGNVLRDFLLNGSKYIRSTLAVLYLKTQNFEINDNVYKILSAGELIHNASLLHDDVLDAAETRRDKQAIWKEFSPNISILAGDYLLTTAIEKLPELNSFELLKKFKNCTKQMVEAEIKQYFLRGTVPSLDDYISVCCGKTAVLFATILESCAQILGAETAVANKFGEIFGLCFQIKNDLDADSVDIDKRNGIYTARDIIGIEKTINLLDNYKEEMNKLIKDFPENIYKKGLEDLISLL